MYTYHKFTPNVLSGSQGDTRFEPNNEGKNMPRETGLYIQDDWEISDKVKVNAGIRYSTFTQIGPYTEIHY